MGFNLLKDRFGRQLNYLRVSVTDRCNFNCLYCRRWDFVEYFPSAEILSYEEILRLIRVGAGLGITKIRITGGEPFVRKDVCSFIQQVVATPGISDVSVTTNGLLLDQYLDTLRAAGIRRLNISLDSLKRDKFRLITGRDVFYPVWENIMAALAAGFSPVKVNVVAMRDINDDEITRFAELTRSFPLHIRFIEYMPSSRYHLDQYRQMLMPEIRARVEAGGRLIPVQTSDTSNIAHRFKYAGAKGEIGFISPVSRHFCATCNRLRLTADGKLRPCLLSDRFVDIKTPLRTGLTDREVAGLFHLAVLSKPQG
ncbi:MAG: GTP 3',8-cyclase MoaA, partial [Thermodesulfobacteriota bacterium]